MYMYDTEIRAMAMGGQYHLRLLYFNTVKNVSSSIAIIVGSRHKISKYRAGNLYSYQEP